MSFTSSSEIQLESGEDSTSAAASYSTMTGRNAIAMGRHADSMYTTTSGDSGRSRSYAPSSGGGGGGGCGGGASFHPQTTPPTGGGGGGQGVTSGLDGAYVRQHLGVVLVKALAEIATLRPEDPVQYLAEYLYAVDNNRRYQQENRELLDLENKVREERLEQQVEIHNKMLKKREEENLKNSKKIKKKTSQKIIEEETKLVKKVSEKKLTSKVEDVPEDKKSANGQTPLHQNVMEDNEIMVHKLIDNGYDITIRDSGQRTPRDLASLLGKKSIVDLIDNFVAELFASEKIDKITRMIYNGYDIDILEIYDKLGGKQTLPKRSLELGQSIPIIQASIVELQTAVRAGDVRLLNSRLCGSPSATRWPMQTCRDTAGRSLLHLATISGRNAAPQLSYLITRCPELVHINDNLDRSCLHYAYAINNGDIIEILKSTSIKQNAIDSLGNLPEYYKESPSDIRVLEVP